VRPWEFTAISVLEQELDYKLQKTALVVDDDEPLPLPQEESTDEQPTDSTKDMSDSNNQSNTTLLPLTTDQVENDASPNADPSNGEKKDSSSIVDPSEPPTACNGNNDESPEVEEGTTENQNGTADHSDTEPPPKGDNGSVDDDKSPIEVTAPKQGTDAVVKEQSDGNGSADDVKSPIEVTADVFIKKGMDNVEEQSDLSKNADYHGEGINGDGPY
jgi:hypothetical protein